jgi:two-component system NarL family response regulator
MNATILIASPCGDRLSAWRQALEGFGSVATASILGAVEEALKQAPPDLLLLDSELPQLEGARGVASLTKVSRGTRVIALNRDVDDDSELALFRAGVRGCCQSDIEPQRLKSVAVAIIQGELWIRRTLTPRLLEELGTRIREDNDSKRAAMARLIELTRREREIAELIGNGESNKQIARQLAITERTVKAHLTEIFRKLGIADRLKLALLIADAPTV